MYDFTLQKIRDGWPWKDVPEGFEIPKVVTTNSIFINPHSKEDCTRAYWSESSADGRDQCGIMTNGNFFGFVDPILEK